MNVNISSLHSFFILKLLFFSFVVIKSISLTHCFFSQLLILIMNCPFNFLNVPLSFLISFVLVLFKLCLIFSFHFFLHSRLVDFYSIFFLLENFLECVAVILPLVKLKLIFSLFFLSFTHFTQIFIQLRNLNICFLDLFWVKFINFIVLLLIILNCFCFCLFIFLFPSRNLLF